MSGPASLEVVLGELAERQHGVVTRAQLLRAGVAARVVDHRVATGRLRPIHRGVYRAGPLVAPRALEMAAVLACGDGAVVSHRSASRLWELLPATGVREPVDVTVRYRERRRPGIRVHRVRALPPDEVTRFEGVPITTPARTLLDLAGVAGVRELERAAARAERRGLVDRAQARALLARYPRRQGTGALAALLDGGTPLALTRSEAEERFLGLVRKGQLRLPEANVVVDGYEVDFLWRTERLIVEVDGFAYHASPQAFERDRRRDAVLGARGFHVLRVTWKQMDREPEAVLVRLAQMLARAGDPEPGEAMSRRPGRAGSW
ncbi:MAG TPA: DUF559 domain-containing protein [Longimicrobiales bacterium]